MREGRSKRGSKVGMVKQGAFIWEDHVLSESAVLTPCTLTAEGKCKIALVPKAKMDMLEAAWKAAMEAKRIQVCLCCDRANVELRAEERLCSWCVQSLSAIARRRSCTRMGRGESLSLVSLMLMWTCWTCSQTVFSH